MPCVVKGEFEVQYQRYSCTLVCFHMVVKGRTGSKLNISVLSRGSEGRPEEMICLKKVEIENGIWLSIDYICRIDCSMCVLLLTSQHFKAVRNQRKETLK